METIIFILFLVFSLYLLWLFMFVFKFNLKEFLSWKQKPEIEPLQSLQKTNDNDIMGKVTRRFIEEMPEFEPIKACLVEQLPLIEIEDVKDEILEDDEVEDNYLSSEEQEDLLSDQEQDTSFWDDEKDEFEQPNSVDDIIHAAQVISGKKKSKSDIKKAKETLKHIDGKVVTLLSEYAIDNDIMKEMYMEMSKSNQGKNDPKNAKQATTKFVITDYLE